MRLKIYNVKKQIDLCKFILFEEITKLILKYTKKYCCSLEYQI